MAEGSHYDKNAADYAVNFIECLTHTKETWAGEKFKLIVNKLSQHKRCCLLLLLSLFSCFHYLILFERNVSSIIDKFNATGM